MHLEVEYLTFCVDERIGIRTKAMHVSVTHWSASITEEHRNLQLFLKVSDK